MKNEKTLEQLKEIYKSGNDALGIMMLDDSEHNERYVEAFSAVFLELKFVISDMIEARDADKP
jgi:hypothetical protein